MGAQNVKKWLTSERSGADAAARCGLRARAADPLRRAAAAASRRIRTRRVKRISAWLRCIRSRSRPRSPAGRNRRPTSRSLPRRPRPPPCRLNRARVTAPERGLAANRSYPAGKLRDETLRLVGAGERPSWHDDRDARARPDVDEPAGVFGIFAVGVVQSSMRPTPSSVRLVFLENRGQPACRQETRHGLASPLARAPETPSHRRALDHERRRGGDDRRLARAAADKARQGERGRRTADVSANTASGAAWRAVSPPLSAMRSPNRSAAASTSAGASAKA